jgi:hypothetical protein
MSTDEYPAFLIYPGLRNWQKKIKRKTINPFSIEWYISFDCLFSDKDKKNN